MNPIIRQVYKGIAYCYFHPEDMDKRLMLNNLILDAWNLGYPRTSFDYGNKEIMIEDMTEWEVKYCFKDICH